MTHKKVTIICADEASCLETVALRGVLEYFGYVVSTHWIGNKKQFLELLRGTIQTDDIVVIAAHGTKGKFCMPTDETVGFDELQVRLPHKTIISLGCATHDAVNEFLQGGCSMYIAPSGYPEGNDGTFFAVKFFWLLAQEKSLSEAFEAASTDIPEGSEFVMSSNSH